MAVGDERDPLARRGVVRASGGPLRDVKVELAVVVVLLVTIFLFTVGWDGPPWLEVLLLFAASAAGAGWVAWRARRVAARVLAQRGNDGG